MRLLHLLNAVPLPPIILIAGYALDLLIGDPEKFPHPVRWIGNLIRTLEGRLRNAAHSPLAQRVAGTVMALVVAGSVYAIAAALIYYSYKFAQPLFYIISVYIVWASLSIKSLGQEAKAVLSALNEGGLEGGRKRLSRIVGRDTDKLSQDGVLKAAVETVSENTSDGVVAPLFYFAIGGPALMLAYKAVNTLDSMVGYKNDKYRDFGWFSARLDDAANFIPSRLTGALIVSVSFILGYNWRRSLTVLIRDGRNHPSPNSGMPEAAVAGALGLKLGGGSFYGGVFSEKPSIGDGQGPLDEAAVLSSIRIMRFVAFSMFAFAFFIRILAIFIL